MHRSSRLIAGLVFTGLLVTAAAFAGEPKVIAAPQPVIDAVKARWPEAKVVTVAKEIDEAKKTVYELAILEGERKIDVICTPAGSLVLFERQIALEDLPAPIAEMVRTKYKPTSYEIVEEVYKVKNKQEKLSHYEVLFGTGEKKWMSIEVSPAGKVLLEEKRKSPTLD